MAEKHLLYFTATRAVLYRWSKRRLAVESSFANNEEGAAAFAAQLGGLAKDGFYVLADLVEEDFHQETVPFVSGKDRRALLTRKLAQRYRDTSLSLALSLGYERTQRREERLLLSAFTNTALFQPWLDALADNEIPLAGVFSVALLAPRLAAKIGPRKVPQLLVTLQSAGLRQSYVENGRMRFSRLGPLDPADAADPARVAEAFDRETARVFQYLTATRIVSREAGAIDAVLVAPAGEKPRIQATVPSASPVKVSVIDLSEAAAAIGLASYPRGAGAEVLFAHLLAIGAPGDQYAGGPRRQYWHLRQVRTGLIAAGAALGAAGLLWAGVQLLQYVGVQGQIEADRQRARTANDANARVTAGFPQLPTSTDNLRVTMQKYRLLVTQTVLPERLLADVAAALEATPAIEVTRINWELATNPQERARTGARTDARAAAPTPPVPGAPPPPKALYEVVELDAVIPGAKSSDFKGLSATINAFVEQIAKRPGAQVLQTKMPFELGSQTRLSGDIGVEQAPAAPRFSVLVARKVEQ